MKHIKDMNLSEVKKLAIGLEWFARDACDISEALLEIVYDDEAHEAIKEFARDVTTLEKTIFGLKNSLEDSHGSIEEDYVINDSRVYVRHMMKLCNNISVNLSHRFNKIFCWTEVDIHEVVNGEIEDTDVTSSNTLNIDCSEE